MFSKWFNKSKPRVYLGKMVVAPREEFSKVDSWGLFKCEDLEEGIRSKLDNLFSLPHKSTRSDVKKNDLGLELVVLKIRGGEFDAVSFDGFGGLPIFWRPKIEVVARLYYLESGNTHSSYRAKEIMPWGEFFAGAISFRGLFRFKPIFGVKDVEILLYKACEKILISMTRAI